MKLEIQKVRFKNIFSYGAIEQEVDFLPGLNLVLGNDITKDRSNAVGKSSFLETIPFALFGKVNRNVKKESIVNWKNRKNCEVILTFRKDGEQYSILRALKPDKFEVYRGDSRLPIPARKLDYQKQIEEEILGIDFKTFISLVYSNINSSQPILSMPANKKRSFIETVFGLEMFSQLSVKCNEKLKSVADKTLAHKTKREFIEKSIEEIQRQIGNLRTQLSEITSYEAELAQVREEYQEFKSGSQKKLEALQEKINKKQNEMNELLKQKYSLDSGMSLTQGKIDILTEEMNKIGEIESRMSDINKAQERYEKLTSEYVSPQEIDKTISMLTKQREESGEEIKSLREKLENVNKELIESNVFIKTSTSSLETLTGTSVCPTCGSVIDSDKIAKEKTKHVKETKKKVDILEARKKEIENGIGSHTRIRNDNEKKVKELTDIKIKMLQLKFYLDSNKHLDEKIENKKALEKDLKGKTKELEGQKRDYSKIVGKIETLEDDLKELKKEFVELKEKAGRALELKNKIMLLREKVKHEKETKERLERLINEHLQKIDGLQKEKREVSAAINRMNGMNDYLEFVKWICRDENVKQYAISSIIPFLNKRMNHYLSEVGHSFYVVLNSWLEEEIRGPGISNCSYGNLSGGEGKSVDFALQMALLDIARIQAGIWPDILELDEILDSSVDSYGLEKIIQILKIKQAEDNNKVFLVSHRREVNDINVDHLWMVTKRDGFSYIERQC